jgi:hypothetical protein
MQLSQAYLLFEPNALLLEENPGHSSQRDFVCSWH